MSEGVNLTEFPQGLATQLGIDLFPAQILASIIFLSLVMLPVLLFTKGKNMAATIIFGLGSLGFCVALGWCPIWIFTIITLTLAFLFGKNIIGVFKR